MSFESNLHILVTSSLSEMRLTNIFSHSIASLFILLTVSLKDQEVPIVEKSNILVCSLMERVFYIIAKKSLPKLSSIFFVVIFK